MKTLILVRHAKSDWKDIELSDFDRPLSKRGLSDAPMMGNILKEKNIKPDIVYASSANRAQTTAKLLTKKLGYLEEDIHLDRNIYSDGPNYIMNMVSKLDNNINTIMLFGHNPDFTYMSSFLSGKHFSNVPTCGVVCIDFEIDSWKEVKNVNGNIRFFEYPKLYK